MNDGKPIAVIRVRGSTRTTSDVEDTLKLLGLTRVNHCVVLRRTPQVLGMIDVVKDYIVWGELDAQTLADMLEKRGMLEGNKRLNEAYMKASGFDSFDAFAENFIKGEAELSSLVGLKKVFRLHPPRKGYRSIKAKHPYGALGNRGAEINEFIKRMI